MNNIFRLLLMAAVFLAGAIAPAAAQTTVANSDALLAQKDTPLTLSLSQITTNDAAGSANGTNTSLLVTSADATSAQGGTVSLLGQSWTNRWSGPGGAYRVAVDNAGNAYATGNRYTVKYASNGALAWTNFYYESFGSTKALAVDGAENIYIGGYVTYGPYPNLSYDFFTLKYASDGTPLWTNRFTAGVFIASVPQICLAVDAIGSVYVAGSAYSSQGRFDYATLKYTSDGTPVWTNRYVGSSFPDLLMDDSPSSIAIDSTGNVYVTGRGYPPSFTLQQHYVTIKYSGDGVPVWTNAYRVTNAQNPYLPSMAMDQAGNVFVTGSGYAVIKYASNGIPVWTNLYSDANGNATSIAADATGNIYVSGYSSDSINGDDFLTIKCAGDGTPIWTNRYDGPGHTNDFVWSMALDGEGNVYVTGSSIGIGSGEDYATIKYASDGAPIWTNRYNGPTNGSDRASFLVADNVGNAYVTGGSLDNSGSSDYLTIKYAADTNLISFTYTPPRGFTGVDTFTYTVTDSLGSNATATVTVVVVDAVGTPLLSAPASPASSLFQLSLAGAPSSNYVLQASSNLVEWLPIATNTAPASGLFPFSEGVPDTATQRFFRVLKP